MAAETEGHHEPSRVARDEAAASFFTMPGALNACTFNIEVPKIDLAGKLKMPTLPIIDTSSMNFFGFIWQQNPVPADTGEDVAKNSTLSPVETMNQMGEGEIDVIDVSTSQESMHHVLPQHESIAHGSELREGEATVTRGLFGHLQRVPKDGNSNDSLWHGAFARSASADAEDETPGKPTLASDLIDADSSANMPRAPHAWFSGVLGTKKRCDYDPTTCRTWQGGSSLAPEPYTSGRSSVSVHLPRMPGDKDYSALDKARWVL